MAPKTKKKWLILAYLFNIDGNAASQTITDRLPFWLERGIKPVVISSPTGKKDNRFPHYQIFSPAPSGILFEVRHIINSRYGKNFIRTFLKTFLLIILLPFYIVEKIFIHLDSHWSWFLSAFVKGWLVIREHKPDIIYSTAGPTSTHLTGYLLSKIFNLPWLVELHDPLIYDLEDENRQFYRFKKWLEKKIIGHAAAVVFFTNSALESAKRRNGNFDTGVVLRPGAAHQYSLDSKYCPGDKIHIGHFGRLADNRNLQIVFKALYEIFRRYPELKSKIILDVYGSNLDGNSKRALAEYPQGETLQVHGRLEYDHQTGKSGRQQVLEAMHKSDLLLLLHGEGVMCNEYIPSKTYEYLLTGRPILGLVEPKSELELMLKEDNHIVVNGNEFSAVRGAILNAIRLWERNLLPIPRNKLIYKVEDVARQLEHIVDKISLKDDCGHKTKRVLIIIRRSLGDVLATSPMINALYEHNNKIEIDLLVNEDTAGMARAIEHVRKVLCYNYSWWDTGIINGVRNEFLLLKNIARKYDVAISLTANERSTIYSIMAGRVSIAATDSVLENSRWRKALLSRTCEFKPNRHIVLNNMTTIKSLGIPVGNIKLSACYSETAANNVRQILKAAGVEKFIIFHPSARYEYKVYPRKLRHKLLNYLATMNIPVIITGGKSDIDKEIANDLPRLKNIYNFIGKTTLEEAIALTDFSMGYIGMDTFNMHIAAAFSKRIVAIFGPTLPQIWSPWSNSLQTHAKDNSDPIQRYGDITLIRAAKECMSCGRAGCQDSNSHSQCLNEITPETIFKEVQLRWPGKDFAA